MEIRIAKNEAYYFILFVNGRDIVWAGPGEKSKDNVLRRAAAYKRFFEPMMKRGEAVKIVRDEYSATSLKKTGAVI